MKTMILLAIALIALPLLFVAYCGFVGNLNSERLAANSRELAAPAGNPFQRLAANAADLNNQGLIFPKFNGDAAHATIMAANDANFDAAHLSEPLTEYIVDYPDEDGLDVLLDAAFPGIPVGRSFSYRVHDDKEAFQAALSDEDIREIGGDFGKVRKTGTQADGRTDNKGLTMVLDNDQGGEDPAVQQRAVSNLRARLLRTELYRGEALLESNDTAGSSNWGGSASDVDPDGDVVNMIDLGGDARGINNNVVLFGGGAWVKRFRALGPKDARGASAERGFTPEMLADFYGVDRVLKSNFRYQSSSSAKSKVVADKVYSYYSKPGLMPDDPSNIKRFVTAPSGGAMFRVYIEPALKKTLVTVEHYSRLVATSTLGIRKLTVTYT